MQFSIDGWCENSKPILIFSIEIKEVIHTLLKIFERKSHVGLQKYVICLILGILELAPSQPIWRAQRHIMCSLRGWEWNLKSQANFAHFSLQAPAYHKYTARKRITRPTMKSFLIKVVYFQVLFEIIGWFSIRPGTANRRLESGALAGITIVAPTCS